MSTRRPSVAAACWLTLCPYVLAIPLSGASAAPPVESPIAEWTRWDAKALALLEKTRDAMEAAPSLRAETAAARFSGKDAGDTWEHFRVAKLPENEEMSGAIKSYIGAAMSDGRGGTIFCYRRVDGTTVGPSWNRVRVWEREYPATVERSWPPPEALVPLRGQTHHVAISDSELAKPADLLPPSLNPIERIRDAERDGALVDVVYAGKQRWRGIEYDVVIYHTQGRNPGTARETATNETVQLFLGKDGLLHRAAMDAECGGTRVAIKREYQYDTPAGNRNERAQAVNGTATLTAVRRRHGRSCRPRRRGGPYRRESGAAD
jgi:hypothetical protein